MLISNGLFLSATGNNDGHVGYMLAQVAMPSCNSLVNMSANSAPARSLHEEISFPSRSMQCALILVGDHVALISLVKMV